MKVLHEKVLCFFFCHSILYFLSYYLPPLLQARNRNPDEFYYRMVNERLKVNAPLVLHMLSCDYHVMFALCRMDVM